MQFSDILRLLLATAVAAILIIAAISDIRTRRIPNWTVVSLLALFVLWTALGRGAGLGPALAAGGLSLAVTFGFYVFGIWGAGDAKLFSAFALFAGLADLPFFGVATLLAGGAVALATLAANPTRAAVMWQMRGKGAAGVPYGVAISLAGLATLGFLVLRRTPPFP